MEKAKKSKLTTGSKIRRFVYEQFSYCMIVAKLVQTIQSICSVIFLDI